MSASPAAPLAFAGGLLIAALPPGLMVFGDSRPFREIAGTPTHVAHYALALTALVVLAVALPRLASVTSAEGRRLPGWVINWALVGTMLTAATYFVQVFVVPYLADVAPVALDDQGGWLMTGLVSSWLCFMGAWATLGAVGLRRRILPTGAGVLVVLAALAQVAIGPLSVLPLGLGLLLLARSTVSRGAPRVAVKPITA